MKDKILSINLPRLLQTLEVSSQTGATKNGGLHRLALSEEDRQIRDQFIRWLEESKLDVRVDDFGNIYGRREGKQKDAPAIKVGSHLDTQPSGGRFDGILGVLTALEVVRSLNDQHIETERPIEIVNFTNEEGARFEPPMLGSGGITGVFTKDYILNRKDKDGKLFGEELVNIHFAGEEENRPANIGHFVELHVEQGPILEQNHKSIGVVEGIQGMTWMNVTLEGQPDHAGPTPMSTRKDALVAASRMITAVRDITKEINGLTTTVGRLSVHPNVVNVIPGKVEFSIDVRHIEDHIREQAIQSLMEKISTIAVMEGVEINIHRFWDIETTHFAEEIIKAVTEAAAHFDYSYQTLYSGAGHDAKYMNQITKTGMIFLPSINGKSHCEEELTLIEDIEKGANVLLHVVQKLANA